MSGKERLIGKKIKETKYNSECITFTLDSGEELIYDAYGECCSDSFIEDIDDITVLQDCTITGLDVVEGGTKNVKSGEVHEWTFYKFTTDKGRCTLSFRNESNGYYSGCLTFRGGSYERLRRPYAWEI